MKNRHRLVISTVMMGQVEVGQWREILTWADEVFGEEVGLEIIATFREPLLSLMIRRLKLAGLAERLETIHGRVDYDFAGFRRRLRHFRGLKKLEIGMYDLLMAQVGETYRATLKFKQAKLLLHAPMLYQIEEMKGGKPRMRRVRLIVENDEKLDVKQTRFGYGLNPVEILEYVKKKGLAKLVFDTGHFWRVFGKEEREKIWEEFKKRAGKTPVYWHLNHSDRSFFELKKEDKWFREVLKFISGRPGDQICLEEPARVALRLSEENLKEVKEGIKRSILCLKQYIK